MDALSLEIALPLRAFSVELALELGAETLALVGPSGAGKTTVLRAIAGLAQPASGRIAYGEEVWFDSERGIDLPADQRSVGLVFQEYALFPHMTVGENVAYGGRPRAAKLLERLRIDHLAGAKPPELSGGERQRVALARALARDPKVLLLDEPLSALDAHTRREVRAELGELLDGLRLPTLLVTHDFDDASVLADSIAVIDEGRLLQRGTAEALIANPGDSFVASLTGANVLRGHARRAPNGLTEVTLDRGDRLFSSDEGAGDVGVSIQPWEISIGVEPVEDSTLNHLQGEIRSIVTIGNRARVRIGPLTAEITAASAERLGLREGLVVYASFKATGTRLVPLRSKVGSLGFEPRTNGL